MFDGYSRYHKPITRWIGIEGEFSTAADTQDEKLASMTHDINWVVDGTY